MAAELGTATTTNKNDDDDDVGMEDVYVYCYMVGALPAVFRQKKQQQQHPLPLW